MNFLKNKLLCMLGLGLLVLSTSAYGSEEKGIFRYCQTHSNSEGKILECKISPGNNLNGQVIILDGDFKYTLSGVYLVGATIMVHSEIPYLDLSGSDIRDATIIFEKEPVDIDWSRSSYNKNTVFEGLSPEDQCEWNWLKFRTVCPPMIFIETPDGVTLERILDPVKQKQI